ncbi:MAG: universal stress protein [Betaproteobacteria bacterium]|uniref:universal stress protein n=1 Tax=Serpentinimonas maccroryi TaxID=1458426 RepID=UPI0020345582|nr:universal stress protein [Serpentinimonas maccroryi]MCL5969368.1 universal stress protein [Betaproteobacteria bacterium]MCM2479673.1 universal stress protein [Serpentinimonas maccroryi]
MKWLIPVDGSELSFEAVAYAVRMAQAGLACELVLVNVQEPATFYELVTLHDAEAIERLAEAAGQDLLAAAEAQVRAAQLPYSTHVRMGEPVALLLEVLEEEGCDGVIMGSHGRGLLGRTLLGSVSQQMLQHAPVPVTFVKHAAQPESDSEPDSEPDSDS